MDRTHWYKILGKNITEINSVKDMIREGKKLSKREEDELDKLMSNTKYVTKKMIKFYGNIFGIDIPLSSNKDITLWYYEGHADSFYDMSIDKFIEWCKKEKVVKSAKISEFEQELRRIIL